MARHDTSAVNIPVLVALLIRVFRPLVFRQTFQWRQVLSESEGGENGVTRPVKRSALWSF